MQWTSLRTTGAPADRASCIVVLKRHVALGCRKRRVCGTGYWLETAGMVPMYAFLKPAGFARQELYEGAKEMGWKDGEKV